MTQGVLQGSRWYLASLVVEHRVICRHGTRAGAREILPNFVADHVVIRCAAERSGRRVISRDFVKQCGCEQDAGALNQQANFATVMLFGGIMPKFVVSVPEQTRPLR